MIFLTKNINFMFVIKIMLEYFSTNLYVTRKEDIKLNLNSKYIVLVFFHEIFLSEQQKIQTN